MHEVIKNADDYKAKNLYGLIGFPLSHSYSKKFFQKKFEQEGITDCNFENFPIQSIDKLNNILQDYHSILKGLAVTIPYKQQVLEMLDDSKNIPDDINACNCIKIVDGKLIGYNTDWVGFEKSFVPLLKQNQKSALVLGSGGAAVAVCFVLKRLGITYKIVSRSMSNTDTLTYNQLTEKIIRQHTIIINTTPVGTFPNSNEFPLIPYTSITPEHYLFDLVYNPEKTKFLEKGEEMGAVIKNGADMLAFQAIENWNIWNS